MTTEERVTYEPGPWRFIEDPEGNFGVYPESTNKFIAKTDTKAHAALIAAAPDLLEALRSIANGFACIRTTVDGEWVPNWTAADAMRFDEIARAAIAKAERK